MRPACWHPMLRWEGVGGWVGGWVGASGHPWGKRLRKELLTSSRRAHLWLALVALLAAGSPCTTCT